MTLTTEMALDGLWILYYGKEAIHSVHEVTLQSLLESLDLSFFNYEDRVTALVASYVEKELLDGII